MRRRLLFAFLFFILLLLSGLALGQSTAMGFEEVARIGQPRPRGLQYDPNYDRIAWVDVLGRLQLVDAKTFEVQHTLYNTGFYNAYVFSHNGKYLALAIDLRLEIWDTQTGELLLTFPPDGALRVEAPLYWSLDDTLVSVNTQVRAPQELRRSENDTTNLPWVWDIASELGERRTILPNARAIPFFDYRNGFVYGANNVAVAGLASRLNVLDITPNGVEVIAEIPANRFEPDPMFAWFSLREDYIYVRPDENSSQLIQIDTATNELVTINVGFDYGANNLENLQGLQLSRFTRIIGNPLDTQDNSLMRFFFGDGYREQFNFNETTVTLVDFLKPATQHSGEQIVALLYIFDEPRGTGRFEFVNFYSASGFAVSPDNNSVAIRRTNYPERVEIYNLDSGIMTQSFLPAMPEVARTGLLAFNLSSTELISDYQRFDIQTGAILTENLQFNNGFDTFYWNDDNQTILTTTSNRLWEWDIHTGEVIRREILHLGEMVVGVSSDGERYLIAMSESSNGFGVSRTYEMVEIGMEERTRVTFQNLEDVEIEQVIYSPNGRNFMAIYTVNERNQHAPGNQIMIYNLDEGALWHLAGDDMPYMSARSYGWLDNQTIYIYSEEGVAAPERIYGIQYHASGIPQCLADAFPEKIGEWSLVWERLNERMESDDLNRLAVGTCQILPTEEEVVVDFIFPSATPTRLPVTATPATIAGVPLCLTNRFSSEARDYAEIWQDLTEGKTDEEIAEMELLLCENLTGSSSPQVEPQLVTDNVQVMTMDIVTGVRSVGSYIPERDIILPPNIELVNEAFRRQLGFYPDGRLSPNIELFAVRNQSNQIVVYRLVNPYSALAQDATSTIAFLETQSSPEARSLSLRPTATQGFVYLGEPRPTFTPTVTPTSPPKPETAPLWSDFGDETEVCPYNNLFTVDNPPPDFAPEGRIVAWRVDDIGVSGVVRNDLPWELDPVTGYFRLNDTLPLCHADSSCNFSFDRQWMYYYNEIGDLILSRPDGSSAQTLFLGINLSTGLTTEVNLGEATTEELYATATALASGFTETSTTIPTTSINEISDLRWLDHHILGYMYTFVDYSRSRNPISETIYLDPETGVMTEPYSEYQPDYNHLRTSVVSVQPGTVNRYTVARTSFNTGRQEGYRYFLYDREDESFTYFGRAGDYPVDEMDFNWNAFGTILFYRYPDDANWYAFLPETEEFVFVGENLYSGDYSTDARYMIESYEFEDYDEAAERYEAGLPIPSLQVWDTETGTRRLYCLPRFVNEDDGTISDQQFFTVSADGVWSPDSRYWLFQSYLPSDMYYDNAPFRTFVLDLETGSVTEISQLASRIYIWMEEVYP